MRMIDADVEVSPFEVANIKRWLSKQSTACHHKCSTCGNVEKYGFNHPYCKELFIELPRNLDDFYCARHSKLEVE